ncbi:MAG: PH domain-containing protein [Opitutaceae bacterium]
MYEPSRDLVLRWLKVPPEPHPPFGDPASLRVFRAGRNYFRLRLAGWIVTQLLALAGIIFWTAVLLETEGAARAEKASRTAQPPPSAVASDSPRAAGLPANRNSRPNRNRLGGWAGFKKGLAEIAAQLPSWGFPLIWVLKISGLVLYLAQIPFTYALRRLDYEMRWYVVTDRSLRIRSGLVSVQEMTMSFANLQQVTVTQGPLQRLLGLADVRVQSAGGGGGGEGKSAHGSAQASLHLGVFHGVDNALEIRDLILERLRQFRATGLGDPDDHHELVGPSAAAESGLQSPLLMAARELLEEARALRRVCGSK